MNRLRSKLIDYYENKFVNFPASGRVFSEVSNATPLMLVDLWDVHRITALATNITSFGIGGHGYEGQIFTVQITDNGVSKTIAYSVFFVAGDATLPTFTIPGQTLTLRFRWNSLTGTFECFYNGYSGKKVTQTTTLLKVYGTDAAGDQALWPIESGINPAGYTVAIRDLYSNLTADAFLAGLDTTATAAGTTVLTVDSKEIQSFTGVTTQTVTLPTTGIVAGQRITVINKSTSSITVQSSGANVVGVQNSGYSATYTSLIATPTAAADWQLAYFPNQGISSVASASTIAARTSHANITADAFIPGFTTTATAVGTTALTIDSTEEQAFTGSTTQIVTLPTTSIVAGHRFTVLSSSTGAITINASAGANVGSISSTTVATLTALIATPTTAAHWAISYSSVLSFISSAVANSIPRRDQQANITADCFIPGFATTATAAATTVLTVDSVEEQQFTGATTQTVTLPTTSVVAGQRFTVINSSTGTVTVQSSGANTILALTSLYSATFVAVQATPTAAAHWQAQLHSPLVASTSAGTSTLAVRDGNANLRADAFIPGLTTTVTAASTTALTVSSTEIQVLTGATTQIITLPTTSVVEGMRITLLNPSSGAITINASGGALVKTLAAGASTEITCLLATPTTAAHWYATA